MKPSTAGPACPRRTAAEKRICTRVKYAAMNSRPKTQAAKSSREVSNNRYDEPAGIVGVGGTITLGRANCSIAPRVESGI